MSFWMRIHGYPATEIGRHSAPTWETLADGGMGEASFTFLRSPKAQHPALRAGRLVEIFCGAFRVYVGRLQEPDRTSWQCSVRGISTDAYRIPALTPGGAVTAHFGTAIVAATSEPYVWQVTNPDAAVDGTMPSTPSTPVTMGQMLDDIAQAAGKRWGQNPDLSLYLRADPTEPMWLGTSEAAAFGVADDDYASILVGRYFNGSIYQNVTVTNLKALDGGFGGQVDIIDLTDRGDMSAAQATNVLTQMLKERAKHHPVNGFTLTRRQITRNGTPAFLAKVRGGDMIRLHGLSWTDQPQQPTAFRDVVIGKTRYTAGEDTIYIEPVGTAPRVLSDVIAAT